MRIVFMGTPEFAIPTLRMLMEDGHEVVGVVTAPDKPSGRGLKLRPSPVKAFAGEHGLHVLQPVKLRNPEFVSALKALAPDLAVVVAFRMLPEMVWSIPSQGTLNLHAALLPDYRGAAPLNWVLINGESETGATTFLIDHKIDTGAMLLQRKLAIPSDWTAGDLHDRMMEFGGELVRDTLRGLEAGNISPQPQDHSKFLHPAPKIFKEDCKIDWSKPAQEVYNFIRGLSPYPTSWTTLNGKSLKIFGARLTDCEGTATPGTADRKDGKLWVCCGDAWIEVTKLQLEGKRRMDTETFLRGYKEEISHVG